MSRESAGRRLVAVALTVAVWCALWGEISAANVLSGALLAAALQVLGFAAPGRSGIRFGPLTRLAGIVAADLVVATAEVAREVLTPTDYTAEGIIAVRVPAGARRHLLLLVVAITVTPGTAVIDADPDDGTLYLHLLHVDRRDDVTEHVRRLADLACQAFPHPADPELVP